MSYNIPITIKGLIYLKYEWKKSEKNFYGAREKPKLIIVPSQQFIAIDGIGNPNNADFSNKVSALYSLAYSIKMIFKSKMKNETEDKITDFTVFPLEGIWRGQKEETLDKSKLIYTIMIKQADFITEELFNEALETVKKKKPSHLYDEISFKRIEDGKSIQILHIGSYDNEHHSFEKMDLLRDELKLTRLKDSHREIYLNNKNRTAEEKLKTILRYSVK